MSTAWSLNVKLAVEETLEIEADSGITERVCLKMKVEDTGEAYGIRGWAWIGRGPVRESD